MLRACLDANLITLHYQPKISLPACEVIGCEALLRCVDPVGRAVAPETVIAVAESGGMIDEVKEWVFREAIEQRQRWSRQDRKSVVSGKRVSVRVEPGGSSIYKQKKIK